MDPAIARRDLLRFDKTVILIGLTLLVAALTLSAFLAQDVGDALTRNTIRLSLACYLAALLMMLRLNSGDWPAATLPGRLARWFWTWAVVAFLVHLAMAFHYYHDWSHTHAFEHTREVSGWGEGLYVSYTFTVLWMMDAVWWWAWPNSYAARGRALHWTLHAFLIFIAFNGTVVYETGAIRWAGLVGTGTLAAAAVVAWRNKLATSIAET
jgi:hypothetical protein